MDIKLQISQIPIEYSNSILFMENRVNEVITEKSPELLWLLEHQNVYTFGTDSDNNQKITYNTKIPFINSGRGGKYTYHGPGQLVIYTIINLKKRNLCDIKKFIWNLEEASICTLDKFGIIATRKNNAPGAWIKTNTIEKKIVALGIRIRKWVTFHGLAINVNTDLSYYDYISPCGFTSKEVTSMLDLGLNVKLCLVAKAFIEEFLKIFPNN